MDMKKILQAFDSATSSKKLVEGTADMQKFMSIINGKQNIKEESVSSFEENTIGGDTNAYLLAADKINDEVMAQIEKIRINADPELLKELMDKFNAFMSAYHAVGKEILQPDLFKDSIDSKNLKKKLDEEQFKSKQEVINHFVSKGKSAASGAAAWDRGWRGPTSKKQKPTTPTRNYHDDLDDKRFMSHNEDLSLNFKDYVNLAEAKKDPCWKGYKMVGTKKKGGKKVPNCVPNKISEATESDPGNQVAQHFAQVLADELALEPEAVDQDIHDEGFRTPSGVPVYAYQDDQQVYYMGVLGPNRPTTLVSTSFVRRGQDNIIEVNAPGEGSKYMVTYSDDKKEPPSLLAYGANRQMVRIAQGRPGQDEYAMVGIALDMLWGRTQHKFINKGQS